MGGGTAPLTFVFQAPDFLLTAGYTLKVLL